MYCGDARLCVCLSVRGRMPALLHRPVCNLGSGRGCPLVVHYWADLQSVHGLRCNGNTRNAWQNPAVIRQAHRTPHALRSHAPTIKVDAPAACATLTATRPFHFARTAGVLSRERVMLASRAYMLVLAVCLVFLFPVLVHFSHSFPDDINSLRYRSSFDDTIVPKCHWSPIPGQSGESRTLPMTSRVRRNDVA